MGDNAKFTSTVRVFFKKEGRIKYISHLDINRCVGRALKRSGLPVWHTLGFNPHIYVTFALPLSLGYESVCESMDFRLTEELPMDEIVTRLNKVFPEGLTAYHAAHAIQKPEGICWADYTISQEFDHEDGESVAEKFRAYCDQPEIMVEKRTKKGTKMIDAKPLFTVSEIHAAGNAVEMTMRGAAGSTLNLNPTLILDSFAAAGGTKADWVRVVRQAILDNEGKEFA